MFFRYGTEMVTVHLPLHTHTHSYTSLVRIQVRVMNMEKVAHSSEYNDSDISFMLTLSLRKLLTKHTFFVLFSPQQ